AVKEEAGEIGGRIGGGERDVLDEEIRRDDRDAVLLEFDIANGCGFRREAAIRSFGDAGEGQVAGQLDGVLVWDRDGEIGQDDGIAVGGGTLIAQVHSGGGQYLNEPLSEGVGVLCENRRSDKGGCAGKKRDQRYPVLHYFSVPFLPRTRRAVSAFQWQVVIPTRLRKRQ